jgi:hypothetical protein
MASHDDGGWQYDYKVMLHFIFLTYLYPKQALGEEREYVTTQCIKGEGLHTVGTFFWTDTGFFLF